MSESRLYKTGRIGLEHVGWLNALDGTTRNRYPRLDGDLSADVAVVGGGLLGTSLALHLAEMGVDVALLEAREIGFGASGRNAGHVATHIEGMRLPPGIRNLPGGGERYLELVRNGPTAVDQLIRRFAITCNYTPTGHIVLANRPSDVRHLEGEQRYWQTQGIAMELLDAAATATATGSSRFRAGLHERAGGRINSYAYTHGLAAAAASLGARVFTDSAVTAVRRSGARWSVTTRVGRVLAERVVACTNAYVTDAIPGMSRAFYPGIPGVVGFKPLPDAVADALVPSGATLSQRGIPAAIQKDVTGRFYFASIPALGRAGSAAPFARTLRAWLRRTFPQLAAQPLEVEAYWTGRTANTLDALPRIHELGPGFFAPIACNGLGITTCTQFGKVLAEAIHRDRYEELPVRLTAPARYRFRSLYDPAVSLMVAGVGLLGRLRGALA